MARILKQYIRYVPAEITTFTPLIAGLVPASGASSPETRFLRGDATWTTLSSTILSDFTESVQDVVGAQLVAGTNVTINYDDSTGQITISSSGGGGISDGDKGDITVSSSGSVWTIDTGVITTTKLGGDITTAGKALLDDADASAQRTTLGLGTAATANTGDFAAASHTHIIGDVTGLQTALDNKLDDSQLSTFGGTLIDDADASAARTTLGLGTLATQSGTFSGTSSGTNTGDQNLFGTIAVSGQSDVVADSTSDTLTLVAGSNITITTNAGTDSITISGTGGGTLGDADYGDITVSGSGTVMTIDNNVVTYAKMQDVSATDKLLGRVTAGAGDIEEVTFTDFAQSLVDDVDASAARTTLGLGTLATQSGTFSGTSSGTNTGDQTITLTGDVTGSGTGSFAATIANNSVTYAKIQDVSATDKLLGRSTAGAGDIEEITCTSAGRALLDDVDAAAQRTTLGLGTLATQSGTFSGTSSGTNTGDQTITLTGNVTGSGTGSFATTIAAGAVTLSMMANMATASILGRNTAGTGSPEVLSASTTKTLLSLNNVENTALSTWAGSTSLNTFGANSVTLANMATIATASILGRNTAGTGNVEVLSAATTKTLLSLNNVENTALSTWAGTTNITTLGTIATGSWNATNIPIGKGGTGAALTDPNADRLMFWDDSAGAVDWLTLGTNLTITGTTLDASGGGGNSFTTIAVSGQSDVVADSSTDTLTLAAGSNVTITTNATTDTITIAASLPGGSGDVVGPGSATDNAVVRYDSTTGKLIQNSSAILEDNGNMSLVSTDAGASGGPALNFHRDSASPAASDVIGQFIFAGEDSGSNYTNYGLMQGVISDPTNGSEDGDLYFQTIQGGTLANRVIITGDGEIRTKIDASACEGLVASNHWIRQNSDYTLTSTTSAQKLFNSTTNGALTLPTGIYMYKCLVRITGMSSTSGNFSWRILGAGTATVGDHLCSAYGIDNSLDPDVSVGGGQSGCNSVAPTIAVCSAGTGTAIYATIYGTLSITASGTLIPSIALNTAAAATVKKGTYFEIRRIGSTSTAYVGAWT